MKPLSRIPAAHLKRVKGVFTDVDDTLTTRGRFSASTLGAIEALLERGIKVVPVTGGPAGWCDHMARTWGIDAVIGEGGAFYFHLDRCTHRLIKRFWYDEAERAGKRQMMEAARDAVLAELPGITLSSDQAYRELDLAIELVNAKGLPLPDDLVADIMAMLRRRGMNSKVSSIHLNAYFGEYDKLAMARVLAREMWQSDLERDRDEWLFIGDSTNDASMFEFFPLSVGVANVRAIVAELPTPPRYVTQGEGGAGFVEMARALLDAGAGQA